MSSPLPLPIPVNLDGLTAPITKLIETVSNAVGVLYEPRQIREIAKAERDAAIIKAQGDIEIQELQRRSEQRIKARESRRQKNIESIIAKSINVLPDAVSDEPVDEDWIFQFFSDCEDVGNEEMQLIWARLLAGEVANPGTFSPRTLALVKMLRPTDAELFKLFCNYVWGTSTGRKIHIFTESTDEYLQGKGLYFSGMLHLENLGLINATPSLGYDVKDGTRTISYFGQLCTIQALQHVQTTDEREDEQMNFDAEMASLKADIAEQFGIINIRSLTDIGSELEPLCETQPDENYCKLIIDHMAQVGRLVLSPNSKT
jgi:hypothetical protein